VTRMMQPQPLVSSKSSSTRSTLGVRVRPARYIRGPSRLGLGLLSQKLQLLICGLLELTVGRRAPVSGLAATVHRGSGDVFGG
jgi:hypothetical protein